MRRVRGWIVRLAGVFSTRRRERELDDEIASHLEMHTQDNIRRGMTPEAARRAAVLKLGSAESLKEQYRDQRGVPLIDHLGQDFRYAVRVLGRNPGFTSVALLTIALGVAGPTINFTMMKAWILEPLPFAGPDALIDLRRVDPSNAHTGPLNTADFLDFKRTARSLSGLAAYRQSDVRVTGADRAERLHGARVTPDFFEMLGERAAMGRVFDAADERGAQSRLAVVSHAMWTEYLGADPEIVGRSVQLDGEPHTIVGVLSDKFQFTLLGRVHVWMPLIFDAEASTNRRTGWVRALGRLRPSATVDQAREEITRIAADLSAAYPETNARRGVRVWTLADEVRRHHDLGFIVPVVFAIVGCVLLIACVNVTNVMLARTSARRQEMAIRLALGASRSRIVRQWLVEHVLLFVVASALGAALAVYGAAWITDSIPVENRQYLRNYAVLTVDRTVLLFALATGALCGALFGWVPAWSGAQADINLDLRDGSGRTTVSRAASRLRSTLVITEVALALALLISAGFLVATAHNITTVDLGFDQRDRLTFTVALDPRKYTDDGAVRGFYDRLLLDLQGRPGVADVAAGSLVPFANNGGWAEFFVEGEAERPPSDTPGAAFNAVSAEYSRAMQLRLERGRFLNASDSPASLKVAMVNRTMAERHFGGRDPIGVRLRIGRGTQDLWTVVGVVGNVKNYETIDAGEPQLYVPFAQRPVRRMTIVVRAAGSPEALVGTVRGAVAAIDPAEPVSDVATIQALIHMVTGPFETLATFVAAFGVVTLLLAAVGVYGVVSYTFAQRTRELGIRMALGARRADVAALVLKQIRTFMLAALIPGLALAWVIANALRAMLVGVTPTDWRIYLAMSALLTFVALLAAAAPVRRATAIDPVTALRHE